MEKYKISLDDMTSNYFHFTKQSNLESIKMDKWNLQTFSNHGIDSSN